MYRVVLVRVAEKDLDALDSSVAKRIIAHLLLLEENPRPAGVKKLFGKNDVWRMRVGDWRVIYGISDERKEVIIYRVRHRSAAY